ncbi:Transcription factor IIIA [Cricetulus griseus]|uniref:Transcription factor IIIA n=1 Tax=Cricetulus griseus TaxID=10029 RepID=G3GWI7_CRIGR|nr:Transcription factor IIIA [Cricetulus griseus]
MRSRGAGVGGRGPEPCEAAFPEVWNVSGRFICSFPDCGASYNKAWKLDAHLCKHTGERPFVCDYEGCGKAFIRDYHLSRHVLIHTGEKAFVCPQEGCGKHFASPSRLKRHMKVHEEEVSCAVCQKTFKRKDYLKQHMKTHDSERMVYFCPRQGCWRTYTTAFNLQSHILSFHEEQRPFVCEHDGCGKTFAMKVKRPQERRSLASRLSGYFPPKRKQEADSPMSKNADFSSSPEGKMLVPDTSFTLH